MRPVGWHHSEETKAKLSAASAGNTSALGHRCSEEAKERMSAAKKGRTPSSETRAKLSAAHMGKIPSPETRARLSIAQTGNTKWLGKHHTDESLAKMSIAQTGHVVSPETRAKLAAAHIGLKASPETCARMSAVRKGKCFTLEHRAKLSAAQKGPLGSGWIDGRTPENHRIRNSPEYVAWRTAVFERDNYTCQDCGAHTGMGHRVTLEAHHIHEFAKYPDERFLVENGATLCAKCHDKTKRKARQLVAQEA